MQVLEVLACLSMNLELADTLSGSGEALNDVHHSSNSSKSSPASFSSLNNLLKFSTNKLISVPFFCFQLLGYFVPANCLTSQTSSNDQKSNHNSTKVPLHHSAISPKSHHLSSNFGIKLDHKSGPLERVLVITSKVKVHGRPIGSLRFRISEGTPLTRGTPVCWHLNRWVVQEAGHLTISVWICYLSAVTFIL
jgi:hypothetical protein